MKSLFIFLFVAALTTTLSSCELLSTSGPTGTKIYTVRDFDALRISSNMTADIRLGTAFDVTATGTERDLNDLRVAVSGKRLTIDYPSWYANRKAMHLVITLPVLKAVDLSGTVQATLTGVTETPTFDVSLTGTSQFTGAVRTERLTAALSGNTQLQLTGQAAQSVMEGSGSTNIYAFGLQTDETRLNLTGQSYTEVSVARQLAVRATGQSRVRYRGNPQTDVQTTGQSRVERE